MPDERDLLELRFLLGELADRVRVHDAAGDPALHDDVAGARGGAVFGRGEVVAHGMSRSMNGSISCRAISA